MVVLKLSKKRVITIIFRILLVLVLVEVGLRLGSFGFIAAQRYENRAEGDGSYLILALGESTTANLHNGQSTWPDELELILNNRSVGIKFEVFNEGLVNADTETILKGLEGNLERYDPDLVIAMIGSNDDNEDFVMHSDEGVRIIDLVKDFRVYKLGKFVILYLRDNIVGKTDKKKQDADIRDEMYKKEEEKLKKAAESSPLSMEMLVNLAGFYNKHGKDAEYYSVTNAIVNNLDRMEEPDKSTINYANVFFNHGLASLRLEKYSEAEKMFKKALELNYDDPTIYKAMGKNYRELNRTDESIEHYKVYLNIIESRGLFEEDASVQLAELYMEKNNLEQAYEILKKVVFLNPNKGQENTLISLLAQDLGKESEAIGLFNHIIKSNANNIEAHMELAWLYLNYGYPNEAEEVLKHLADLNPRHLIRAYESFYARYEKKGEFEKAAEMEKRAAELRKRFYGPKTQKNYRELYAVINEEGIKLIAMQYPNLDVQEIKNYFEGKEEIIFVSNKENFKKALEKEPFDDYFIDSDQNAFGHATLKGNRLIAENAADAVISHLGLKQAPAVQG